MPAGRPTDYSEEFVDYFCSLLVDGTSVNTLCKRDDMPTSSTIFLWLSKHKEFSDKYAKAKEMAAEALAEEIFDISDNQCEDYVMVDGLPLKVDGKEVTTVSSAKVQQAKLRVDSRKWYLSKIVPKKYGDKLQTENTTTNINTDLSEDALDKKLKVLIDAVSSSEQD